MPTRQKVRINLRVAALLLPIAFGLLAIAVLVYDHFARVRPLSVLLAAVTIVMVSSAPR